jgi:hypothetical protein
MLPLPLGLDSSSSSSMRGVEGLTLLGPVLGGAAAAGSSPKHRPKQPSIAEQLQELQHILSADMAAEAAAAAGAAEGVLEEEVDGEEQGGYMGEGNGSTAAAGSSAGSEGNTTEDGIGFEAVGLDGLPVYGPHLPPQSNSNSDDEVGDDARAELLRLLRAQQDGTQTLGDDDAGDISVERILELLNAGTQPEMGMLEMSISGPGQLRSRSPVTAITELPNSSAGSTADAGKGFDESA